MNLRVASRGLLASVCVCLLFLLAVSTDLRAQAVSGIILGTLTDPTGATVNGATVTLKNIDTNVSGSVLTNESGNYTATRVASGNYEVTIERPGSVSFE